MEPNLRSIAPLSELGTAAEGWWSLLGRGQHHSAFRVWTDFVQDEILLPRKQHFMFHLDFFPSAFCFDFYFLVCCSYRSGEIIVKAISGDVKVSWLVDSLFSENNFFSVSRNVLFYHFGDRKVISICSARQCLCHVVEQLQRHTLYLELWNWIMI